MTSPTTLTDLLAPIKKRLEDATPGPWLRNNAGGIFTKYEVVYGDEGQCEGIAYSGIVATCHPSSVLTDCELIAHAPTDLSRLIRAVELMDAALSEYANIKNWKADAYDSEENGFLWCNRFMNEGQDYSNEEGTIMYSGHSARQARAQVLEMLGEK